MENKKVLKPQLVIIHTVDLEKFQYKKLSVDIMKLKSFFLIIL